MAHINIGTASGTTLGSPSAGDFYVFINLDNSNLLTIRDSTGSDTVYSISSKRDLTAQKNSIEDDGGDLQLVGDELTPGNNQYYGTDQSGSSQKDFIQYQVHLVFNL